MFPNLKKHPKGQAIPLFQNNSNRRVAEKAKV